MLGDSAIKRVLCFDVLRVKSDHTAKLVGGERPFSRSQCSSSEGCSRFDVTGRHFRGNSVFRQRSRLLSSAFERNTDLVVGIRPLGIEG